MIKNPMLQSRISGAFGATGLSPVVFVTSALREDPRFCSCGHFVDAAHFAACKHPFRRRDQLQLWYLVSVVGRKWSKDSGIQDSKIFCITFFPSLTLGAYL